MRVSVLGSLTVTVGETSLNVGGPKQRTVLAMLVAHAGTRVSADVIVEAVYGEEAAVSARRTVQTYVSTLRNEMGDVIEKASGGWRLNLGREQIDAIRFEDLVESAGGTIQQAPERSAAALRDALALWRGHPYADVEAHGHLDGEIIRLSELRASAQAARIDADLACGHHGDLVGEIEALLVEHPYREKFRAQHMIALYRAGRQQEALRSYSQMRALLLDELGIDPTAELQNLEQQILEQDPALLETQARSIKRRAVLVADPGDPIEIAALPPGERDELIGKVGQVLQSSGNGSVLPAGTASYAIFEDASQAAATAEAAALRFDGAGLRMAIDWGDVEVGDGMVSGPPVSRAARLVAVAHRGQVLLSADAQQVLSSGGGPGLRFETLGTYDLAGLEPQTAIYQLLVGDPPQTFSDLIIDRVPPPLPGGGHRSVPGYELRDSIGPGSVGELYLAYQPSVGREVMVEVIPRAQASDPEFVRFFEADVQRLSLLDHPNISPVLDYWRDPEGAFVVYRHHRGGVLDLTAVKSPRRLLAQIGSALAYAHSYGVIHGSVTPQRVFLDETGNGYLLGFPIGRTGVVRSTDYPEYIAPETLGDALPTAQTDVFALGVLAEELFTGRRAAGDAPLQADDPVIARAINDDPAVRHGSVVDFLVELNPEESDSPELRFTETRNPYKGLAAFHESDARDFFGRTELTRQLINRLRSQNFLAVVGPSGSGKSSVVRAGLIPAVRRGEIEGSETWLVTDMLPGSHPFLELRRALERVAVDMPVSVMESLAAERPDALEDVGSILPEDGELLLLVDQFEELFTLVDDATRAHFVDLLATAVKQGHASVVVTMRADFLDRPLAYSELADLFDRRVVTVGSPNQGELRDAVVLPASGVGVEIDPALSERIVTDVHDRPGALPLLQHALSEVFGGRDSDLLTLDAYEEVGGVTGSLANRAERVYQELEVDEQTAAKQLLLRLVTITDESAPTRRRVRVTDLEDLDADTAIRALTDARLLVVDSDPDTRTPTVEVAHEALLVHWPRLSALIEGAREDLTLSRRLEESMRDWEASGRDDAYLLTGARLAQHQTWTSTSALKLTSTEAEYLDRSTERDRKLRSQRRRRRNWITGGFAAAAVVASVFGVMAVQSADRAGSAAAEAELEREQADEQRNEAVRQAEIASRAANQAKANELFANAAATLEEDPQLSILLTLAGIELGDINTLGTSTLRDALRSHHLLESISGGWEGRITSSTISADGTDVYLITDEGELVAVSRGEEDVFSRASLPEGLSYGVDVGVDQDGSIIAAVHVEPAEQPVSGEQTGLLLIDPSTMTVVSNWYAGECGAVLMGLSADGGRALIVPGELDEGVCHHGQVAHVIDLRTMESLWSDLIEGLDFDLLDPNFQQVYLGSDGRHVGWFTPSEEATIVDIDTGDETVIPLGFDAWNLGMAFSDGSMIVIGSRPIRVYDIETGELIARRSVDAVTSHRFLVDGSVASVFRDGDIEIWDPETGDLITRMRGDGYWPRLSSRPVDDAGSLLVLDDGTHGAVDVFSIGTPDWGATAVGACRTDTRAIFLAWASLDVKGDRGVVSAVCPDESGAPVFGASILDLADRTTEGSLGDLLAQEVVLSPDANRVAMFRGQEITDEAGNRSETVEGMVIVDLDTSAEVWLEGTCEQEGHMCDGPTPQPVDVFVPVAMTWSPDGALVAASSYVIEGVAKVGVWDADTGTQVWHAEYEAAAGHVPSELAFNPDGTELWLGYHSDRVDVLETQGWTLVRSIPEEDGGDLVQFVGDRFFAESFKRNELVELDPETGAVVARQPYDQTAGENHAAFSLSQQKVATMGEDGAVRVRDLATWESLEVIQVADNKVQGLHWMDEETLLVAVADGRLLAVDLSSDSLLDLARERITRGFNDQECERFDIAPCPSFDELTAS